MTESEFADVVGRVRRGNPGYEHGTDPPASDEQLDEAERPDRSDEEAVAGFVAVVPNGTGDQYGFVHDGARCERGVWFRDHGVEDDALQKPEYPDFFEYLASISLDMED